MVLEMWKHTGAFPDHGFFGTGVQEADPGWLAGLPLQITAVLSKDTFWCLQPFYPHQQEAQSLKVVGPIPKWLLLQYPTPGISRPRAKCSEGCALPNSQGGKERGSHILKKFYWSIIDLQCCVSFRCTAKCQLYICVYVCVCVCVHFGACSFNDHNHLSFKIEV